MSEHSRFLTPSDTCWRIGRADRFAVIIDAADYSQAAKAAMLEAEHSIFLIGLDFDTRIQFEPREQTLDGPNKLGDFLSWLPKQKPELKIYLLKWDLGMARELARGVAPILLLDWTAGRRLHFRLDGVHPIGAAHHQKVVVIDDALTFCGGIDMTAGRWDITRHPQHFRGHNTWNLLPESQRNQ